MKSRASKRRTGNVLVMTAFMMTMLITFVALAVDIGYIYTIRNELQRTADAAAIAATWELVDEGRLDDNLHSADLEDNARTKAAQYAALNKIGRMAPLLAENDIETGYMATPWDPSCQMVPAGGGTLANAVRVRVQRTNAQNGEVPLFFARMLGMTHQSAQAEATAALIHSFSGFQMPSDGTNLMMLPFVVDLQTWDNLMNGIGTDSYSYNPATKTVGAGSDGILECNLYPQSAGAPGNRGTIDIGGTGNNTEAVIRQILYGFNQTDYDILIASGRSLDLGPTGYVHLMGDTGISAGVSDALASIAGQPRILPIFSSVSAPGNNAEYTIVKFVGVRVMDVKLTGSMKDKRLIIQSCNMVAKGGIPSNAGSSTDYVYSPVWLVR